jgi:histidinol-phosphate aminotransferase
MASTEPTSPQIARARPPEPVPGIADIERYGETSEDRAGALSLDRNERLAPLPEAVVDELRAQFDSALLTSYPTLEPTYEDVAAHLGVPREHVLLTPGSDAAIKALFHVYVQPGDRVAMLQPSYAMYPVYARIFRAQAVETPFAEDLTFDLDAFLASMDGARLVLLANPNQPTGTQLTGEELERIVERAGEAGALLGVDEAYFPFSGTSLLPGSIGHPHVVVTRTFSKAWGIAGLRLGAAVGDPEVVRALYKVHSAHDVNAMAALTARTLLRHPEVAADYVALLSQARAHLAERVEALGLTALPSATNFLVIRLNGRIAPGELVDRLRERKIIVKGPFGHPSLADCIRITLGPPQMMDAFADAVAEVLG